MIPVLLSFKDKKVAIFGCGEVGKRRALKLLKDNAKITIYSKTFDKDIEKTDKIKKIKIDINKLSDEELRDIIKEYDFILACASEDINKRIVKIAKELNKYINSSNILDDVNFIIPAYTEVDGVIFSIYTGGKSPLLAKNIRILIENYLKGYDLDFISSFRKFLIENIPNQKDRKKILNLLFSNENFKKELLELINKYMGENDNFKS
ncbi:precorrin-2 dehydrogenase/sirohydrochlorin ferrochelatase family protein [Methanocaldococcus indicus]|uniref:precorrin-2 dehydrogenase/sirohydrochlorin ferrochelatase family protein n=1 Tax=Methanocaldococcus indicus TaxID=213231 RepID=UPI003C6CF49A